MGTVTTIAQAFFDRALTIPTLAKVEFMTHFVREDLKHLTRTPLLLISPHMIALTNARQRQRGRNLLLQTMLITRNQRGEHESGAALEIMAVLDDLDEAVVNNDLGLAIQPFDIYRREAVAAEKGLSVVRTIYTTVIYDELSSSKFEYLEGAGMKQTIEFSLISTSSQTEEIKDGNDYDRSLDGSMRAYSRRVKKKFELRLTLVPTALKEQLRVMKATGTELTFYRDKRGCCHHELFLDQRFQLL